MLRRSICAAVVVLVLGGFVLAETITCVVTKVDGDKVTATVRAKGAKKGEKGEAKEFTLTKDTKFAKRKGKETEDATKDDFIKAVDKGASGRLKGVLATLDVEDGKVKKVTFGGGMGGKKKGDK